MSCVTNGHLWTTKDWQQLEKKGSCPGTFLTLTMSGARGPESRPEARHLSRGAVGQSHGDPSPGKHLEEC